MRGVTIERSRMILRHGSRFLFRTRRLLSGLVLVFRLTGQAPFEACPWASVPGVDNALILHSGDATDSDPGLDVGQEWQSIDSRFGESCDPVDRGAFGDQSLQQSLLLRRGP